MAKVFISYSRSDYIGADGKPIEGSIIAKILSTLSNLKISYWLDMEGIDPGSVYAEQISENIRACEVFVIISYYSANSSPWTLREISSAIDYGKKIIPMKIDDAPYASSVALYLAAVQHRPVAKSEFSQLGPKKKIHL